MVSLNSINTNIAAFSAQANINDANSAASSSISRLSSGDRIVRAADDVASLSVGTSLRTNVSTLKIAALNTSQGSSLLQVADGALAEITDILQRQASIATQASSGSLTSAERGFLNQEFQALTEEIDRLAEGTNFNGVSLLNGTLGSSLQLASTDAIAALVGIGTNGNAASASTTAIEAFYNESGDDGAGNNAGTTANAVIQFVGADGTTQLTNGEFEDVNPAIFGDVGSLQVIGIDPTVSVDVSLEINGVTFTGSAAAGADYTLRNGDDRIRIIGQQFAAGDIANATAANARAGAISSNIAGIEISRTSTVNGLDFEGTIFEGVTGGAGGPALLRSLDPENATISNFRVINAATGANVLGVDVGGETYTATGVVDAVNAGDIIDFTNSAGEALSLDLTGAGGGTALAIDIFANLDERQAFVDGLNRAFANASAGVNFAVGTTSQDVLTVKIGDSRTGFLYGNEDLNVLDQPSASFAIDKLSAALDTVTSLRADVGALQSRFDFAAANIESSIQNQDAARGVLLDTDVAAESTSFATSQVQLQAGIAVLAQANLLPQNLLKLIG